MTDSLLRVDSSRHRSETRSTSNQHSRRTSSIVNPNVHSWVQHIQQNQPPPPEHATTPLHVAYALPEHSYHVNSAPSQGHLRHRPLQIMNPTEADDDEYYNIDANRSRLGPSYLAESSGRGQRSVQVLTDISRSSQDEPRSRSFVGGFVRGLKNLPKKVLRNRNSTEKRQPALIAEEGESTEAVTTLPKYRSNPSTPIVGPSTVTYVQATEMPMPMPMPEMHERLPADALRSVRPRHPSYRVTGPTMHGLAEEQTAQIYDLPPNDPPTFMESTNPPTPQLDADRATMLFYDNPADGTSTNGQPQSQSLRISYISHHTPNTRAPTATPQHIPSQIPSEAQEAVQEDPPSVQSPVLAHPPLSTDYRKMSLNSHDAVSRTTHTSSCSLEPSFSSELSPVKRFLHIIQSLPWVSSERITSDYSPGRATGVDKELPKKPLISWYRRPGDRSSRNVDLLSTGSQGSQIARALSNSSTATPGPSPSHRVRRSHSHLQGQRHQRSHGRHHRHHRQHRHHHTHGRHRQRRRNTTTTVTDGEEEEELVHNSSPVLPSVYPPQIAYAYQYAFPPNAPRGPRSRHSPAYPGGYVPFQPMPSPSSPGQVQMGSPVYVVPANAQSQDGFPMHGQPMYVLDPNYHHNHAPGSPSPSNQDGELHISQDA